MAVIGTGLIGTSVALAASSAGVTVFLSDLDRTAARTAAALGAGRAEEPAAPVDLAVLAVPPGHVAGVLCESQHRGLARAYTDVASVKAGPERAVLERAPQPGRYAGGHPMAGRERSGPLAARAALFRGRPWVLTPHRLTSPAALGRARELAELCGASPVLMSSGTHDQTVALTSHVPHLVASLMAARLRDGPSGTPVLAGQGLRDVTRIAGGDVRLWADILRSNAAAMTAVVRELQEDLARLAPALEALAEPGAPDGAEGVLDDLLRRGKAGLRRIRRTDAAAPGAVPVRVRVRERPGELARLIEVADGLGVDADTAAVDGAGEGVLDVLLPVAAAEAGRVAAKLRADGWEARAAVAAEDVRP